jgi:lipopolysaccharide transport system permease protein
LQPIEITPLKTLELPDFKELWSRLDLLVLLVKRSYKSRFQQTYIGYLWILFQPLIQMLIFYVLFGILIRVPVGNIPYQLFFLSGFVVWQLFSQVVNGSTYSLQENLSILTKVYFPRMLLPLSAMIVSLIDFFVNLGLLTFFVLINSATISWRIVFIVPLVLFLLFFASGVGLWFGSLLVVYRDIRNVMTFILMMWMYITPVIYPSTLVPEKYQLILSLNPMTVFVNAFRWMVLGYGDLPTLTQFLISFSVSLIIWFTGAVIFRYMESKVADIL